MEWTAKRLGYFQGWLSAIINTALFAVKYWIGNRLDSVSMVADAWHTLSDTLASLVVVVGFWVASWPADRKHPFGHGRADSIAAIVIATLLALIGMQFLIESVSRLWHGQAAAFSVFAIVVFASSVVIKEALAQFSFWAGRRAKSQSLKADAWHHRSDAIASGLIVVGALVSLKFGSVLWWVDGILGLGVSLLLLYAAYDILRGSSGPLLGEYTDPETQQQITAVVREYVPNPAGLHHLHLHRYGGHTEATLHVRLPADMAVREAHAVATAVEVAIRTRLQMEATVHIEPEGSDPSVTDPGC